MVIKIKTTNSFLKRCDLHKLAWNGMVYTKKLLNRNFKEKRRKCLNKEIITREFFVEIMEDVKKTYKYQEGLNDYFSKNGADGYVYQPDCIDTTIKILHKLFEEKDVDEWISYFCFELDFGKKYKEGCIKDENGKDIPLATSDDLYTILTE